jgi:O-antigen ligase
MDIDINLRFFSFSRKISINKQWIRFGIISIAIFMAVIVPYWGSANTSQMLLILLGGIAGASILLRQLNIGFLLLFLAGFYGYQGPGGVNASAIVVAFLLVLWFMDMFVVKQRIQFVNSRVMLPVFIFLVLSVLAFGMGQVPWFAFANQAPLDAQAGGFAIFALSVGAFLLTAHLVEDVRWLKIIVWTFIGIGTVYILGRVVGLRVIDQIYLRGLTAGSMFWVWLVSLTLSQALFNSQLRKHVRALLVIIVVLTFYVAIVQAYDWKSGWLPPLAAAAVLLSLRYRRILFLTIPIGLFVAYSLATSSIGAENYSWGTRTDAWKIVLEISRVNPLFGLGFSNYYWYTPLFPIRGWFVQFNSHSQYVDLIAQVGILGLLCFLWIFFEVGRLSWNLIRQLSDGFARSYTYGVLAGLVASLVAGFLVDWILPFAYNIGFTGFRASVLLWIFFGGVVSIEQFTLGKTKT